MKSYGLNNLLISVDNTIYFCELPFKTFAIIMTLLQNAHIKRFGEVYLLSIQDANLTLEEQ